MGTLIINIRAENQTKEQAQAILDFLKNAAVGHTEITLSANYNEKIE